MYTREILPPRASPIEDGMPLIGTWTKAFDQVDLLEIKRPFRYPLPRWMRDARIKEWECFSAHDDQFMLEAMLCNVKLYRMAQVLLYDKVEQKKLLFRKFMPGTGWRLPRNLANSSVDSQLKNFYFHIHSWLDADTVKLDLNIEETRRMPSLTVHLAYSVSNQDAVPLTVSLGFNEKLVMYVYKTIAPVRGDMVFNGKHIVLKQDTCTGFFCDYKGFFPYRMQETICSAAGFDAENRRFGFHIAENQCRENNRNNENALWINGQLTPLPPVRITMPNGPDADWIIQDLEGMVDLTFTPKVQNRSGARLIITHTEFTAPLGFYNGMLMGLNNERIQIKNLFGMGEKLFLRV